MADLWEVYADEIHDNFKIFYANWVPNTPMKLGDFGDLQDNVFVKKGNITEVFDVAIRETPAANFPAQYSYKTADSTEVTFNAKGSLSPSGVKIGNASLDVKFTRENSVLFNAAKCVVNTVEDQVALGKDVLKLFSDEKWNDDWVVVTSLVKSDATTVIVSSSSNSMISLEADVAIEKIQLTDASLKLGVKSEKSIGFSVITESGMCPLLGFSALRRSFPLFGSKSWTGLAPGAPRALQTGSLQLRRELKKANGSLGDLFHFRSV